MDSRNVAVRLTENQKILDILRERLAFIPDPENGEKETYSIQFDAKTYKFTPGKILHFSERVGRCLCDTKPLLGGTPTQRKDKDGNIYTFRSGYDAQPYAVLEIIETWNEGEEAPSARKAKATTCHVCEPPVDMKSARALAEHILAKHTEEDIEKSATNAKGPKHAPSA